MKSFFIYISLIILIHSVKSLDDFLDENVTSYQCLKINDKIEIGDSAVICIHIKELDKRMAFKVEVDKYTTFSITGAYLLGKRMLLEEYNELSFIGQISDKLTKIPTVY